MAQSFFLKGASLADSAHLSGVQLFRNSNGITVLEAQGRADGNEDIVVQFCQEAVDTYERLFLGVKPFQKEDDTIAQKS